MAISGFCWKFQFVCFKMSWNNNFFEKTEFTYALFYLIVSIQQYNWAFGFLLGTEIRKYCSDIRMSLKTTEGTFSVRNI